MKRRNSLFQFLMPLIITLSLFVVFYDRIACKPSTAGFWLIFALGAAAGVAITGLLKKSSAEKEK